MHTHERTIAAALIHDPDRKTPEHEQMCRFLAEPEQAEAILRLFDPNSFSRYKPFEIKGRHTLASGKVFYCARNGQSSNDVCYGNGSYTKAEPIWLTRREEIESIRREHRIATQSNWTVGFLDVLISGRICMTGYTKVSGYEDGETQRVTRRIDLPDEYTPVSVVIEVKSGDFAVAEAIRQLSLYGSHYGHNDRRYVLAGNKHLDRHEQAALKAAGITYVRLAAKYEAWLKCQREDTAIVETPEL